MSSPTKGGPSALPGWQEQFDIYSSRPLTRLSNVSLHAHERMFDDDKPDHLRNGMQFRGPLRQETPDP